MAISTKTTALAFMVLSVWHAILILPKISSDNFPIYFTLVSNSLLLQVDVLGLSMSEVPSLAQLLHT